MFYTHVTLLLFNHVIKITISFILSVCTSVWQNAWNNSAPIGRIFMKFEIRIFLLKSVEKIQVVLELVRNLVAHGDAREGK